MEKREIRVGNKPVHLEGKLWKRGQKVKRWKNREFVLTDEAISYGNGSIDLGRIVLETVTRVDITHIFPTKPHAFQIVTPERTLYLCADSKEERDKWINSIRFNFTLLEDLVVSKESENY